MEYQKLKKHYKIGLNSPKFRDPLSTPVKSIGKIFKFCNIKNKLKMTSKSKMDLQQKYCQIKNIC